MASIACFGSDSRFIEIIRILAEASSDNIEIYDFSEDFYPNARYSDYTNISAVDLKKGIYFQDLQKAMYRDNKLSWRNLDVETEYWYFAMRSKYRKVLATYDKVLFSNIPHEGLDIIIAEVAEEIGLSWFAPWQAAITPLSFQLYSNGFNKILSSKDMQFSTHKNNFVGIRHRKVNRKYIKKFQTGKIKKPLSDRIINYLYSKQDKKLDLKSTIASKSFALKGMIALHMQPELTTEPMASEYANPIVWVETLLSLYPNVHWSIREHPDESRRYRGEFLKKYLVDGLGKKKFDYISANDKLDISDVDVVATLNGTIGVEALVKSKYVICHKSAFYIDVEGAIEIGKPLEILTTELNNPMDRVCTTQNLHKGIIDPYYVDEDDQSLLCQGWKNVLKIVSCY